MFNKRVVRCVCCWGWQLAMEMLRVCVQGRLVAFSQHELSRERIFFGDARCLFWIDLTASLITARQRSRSSDLDIWTDYPKRSRAEKKRKGIVLLARCRVKLSGQMFALFHPFWQPAPSPLLCSVLLFEPSRYRD